MAKILLHFKFTLAAIHLASTNIVTSWNDLQYCTIIYKQITSTIYMVMLYSYFLTDIWVIYSYIAIIICSLIMSICHATILNDVFVIYFFIWCYTQWIGSRENLQETIDFPIKYGVFL